MAIYRGPGGSGDATTDAASQATVATTKAAEAAASASAASSSATSAATEATNASTSASNSATSATASASSAAAASTSETNAASSATNASTSASNAATSATNAATSETNAANSASAAATSATNAATSASNASTSETNAASSATSSATSATNAATSETNAAASYDSFDDRYLGAKSSAPSVDNDGDALLTGALYWNTGSNQLFVWAGSAWEEAAFSISGSVTSFNTRTGAVTLSASDVNTALGSDAVLDSDIGSTVQAHSAVLDATTASYTTAEETKLAGIETAATADQTAGEIKTAYESNANTNAFTDAEQTKLAGIEANATADQSAAEIKTAYESNADTNAFTDAEQTKLSGIEALADVTDTLNVTAAGALMDSEVTNLAQVKAFNSADYATAAQGTLADSALQSSDIGSTVQGYDVDTLKADTADTLTAPFRGTVTADNDLSFDLNVTNNFSCTPSGAGTLTFTNHTAGQSGFILLDNSGGHAIAAAATTKINAADLTTISTAGVYTLVYFDNGTNAYVSVSRSFA